YEHWQRIPLEPKIVVAMQGDANNLHIPDGFVDPQLQLALKLIAGEPTRTLVTQ
ncbi:MAG: hypothetical protein ACI97A_002182, partial [Planctomycetota bacterium]